MRVVSVLHFLQARLRNGSHPFGWRREPRPLGSRRVIPLPRVISPMIVTGTLPTLRGRRCASRIGTVNSSS